MQDNVMPKGKWVFDDEVAQCFDEMLQRSIPNYETMRELVYKVGRHYVKDGAAVMDIGCSNGNAALPFVKTFNNQFILCDVSESFLDLCRKGFKEHENVQVIYHDLRNGVPDVQSCLILSILTIQFTPIEYRQKIINSVYEHLQPGGAFIFVEKLLGTTYDIDNVLVDEYYELKRENQYTQEQIQTKRKSLEGVLVPITESWNIDLLRSAGFKKIDCFWRYLNFAGYLAVKA
jgi:tRNA (cmo5U34)-methyltransferase